MTSPEEARDENFEVLQTEQGDLEEFPRETNNDFKPMTKHQIAKKYTTAIAVRNAFKIHNYNLPKCDRFSAIEQRAAGKCEQLTQTSTLMCNR
jgi:hypothetical protein